MTQDEKNRLSEMYLRLRENSKQKKNQTPEQIAYYRGVFNAFGVIAMELNFNIATGKDFEKIGTNK